MIITIDGGGSLSSQRNGFDERLVAEIPHLRRYARSLTRGHGPTEADDLVQTCIERALAKAHTWDPDINLRARLFAIMHNLFVSAVRRPVREFQLPLNPEVPDSSHMRQESYMELRALSQALDQLPAEQREAVVLVALEGMTYEEVSEILRVPIGTVRSRLSRGREALREAVGRPASVSKAQASKKAPAGARRRTAESGAAS